MAQGVPGPPMAYGVVQTLLIASIGLGCCAYQSDQKDQNLDQQINIAQSHLAQVDRRHGSCQQVGQNHGIARENLLNDRQ